MCNRFTTRSAIPSCPPSPRRSGRDVARLIATGAVRTHLAALIALLVAIVIAILLFTMPAGLAIRATILGAVIGFFPIGWIVLNVTSCIG